MHHLLWICIVGFIVTTSACGGFFCSLTAPVDQTSEQIIFAVDNNEVTAHIRIQYRGPSRDFSWVLPLPTPPKLNVGSNVFFEELIKRTEPQFRLKTQQPTTNNPQCNEGGFSNTNTNNGGTDGNGSPNTNNDAVKKIGSGQVGPFDFALLLALKGNAQDVVDWLTVEGYDQPPQAAGLLQQYAEYNYTFLALKLNKNSNSGNIQPLVVKYWFKESVEAMSSIPLKLTQVSSIPDMPVYVWILGRARAVPVNFLEMAVDYKVFDWMNCGWSNQGDFPRGCIDCKQHYKDVITTLANKAEGHAFVTEYSGSPNVVLEDWDPLVNFNLRTLQNSNAVHVFIEELEAQGVPNNALTTEIIKKWIPFPTAARGSDSCGTETLFYASWNVNLCVKEYMDDGWQFDPKGFANDINDRIVQPIQDAISLLGKYPVITRLFTTISPEEMTLDPLFVFDATLPLVPLMTSAEAIVTCPQHPDPDAESLYVQINVGKDLSWAFNGRWNGCEFLYDPPLTLDNGRPKLYKRTGTPATSGEVGVDLTDPEEIRIEVANTLTSLKNVAMDLMPDNTWTEIPNNDDFRNRSPLGIRTEGPNRGTDEETESSRSRASEDNSNDDDSNDDDNDNRYRRSAAVKLVISHVLFIAAALGYFFLQL